MPEMKSIVWPRFAVLALFVCASGCTGGGQRDLVRTVAADGSIHREYEELNGVKDGLFIEYENMAGGGRRLKFLGEFKLGKESGAWIRFSHVDGVIDSLWHMNEGKPVGRAIFFGQSQSGADDGTSTILPLNVSSHPEWQWDRQGVPSAKAGDARVLIRKQDTMDRHDPMHLPREEPPTTTPKE